MSGERWNRVVSSAALLILLLAGAPRGAWAQAPVQPAAARQTLAFVTHAAFFSQETHRTPSIDPQIFVREDSAAEGTGPQNIEHVAGVRPARLDDAPELVAYDAKGNSLGFTLGKWFAASGTAELAPGPTAASTRVSLAFTKLIPFGVYSLFRIAFSPDGATFRPLDGDGTTNNFTAAADGSASPVVTTSDPLQRGDAIVLVYHADALQHGASRGTIGLDAHHQLIVRLP
jgi:hypothetical protein